MIILGIYTHLNIVHLSLKKNDVVIKSDTFDIDERSLSSFLPKTISEYSADFKPDCIALHKGPGGFTSVRVTCAFVQGLCFGFKAKIYAVDHFTLLQKVFQFKDGTLVIDNKGAILPVVEIINFKCSEIEFLTKEEIKNRSPLLTVDYNKFNVSETLNDLAFLYQEQCIKPSDLTPEYGLLPNYKKSF